MKLLTLKLAFAVSVFGSVPAAMACTPSSIPPDAPVGYVATFNSLQCRWVFIKFSDLVKPAQPKDPYGELFSKKKPELVPDVSVDVFFPKKKEPNVLEDLLIGGAKNTPFNYGALLRSNDMGAGWRSLKLGTEGVGG